MRTLFRPFLASLVVLFALFVLISEDHTAPSGSRLRVDGERSSDLGEGLMEVLLLRHQRQSDVEASNIAEAQQLCTIGRYWYLFKRLTAVSSRSMLPIRTYSVI